MKLGVTISKTEFGHKNLIFRENKQTNKKSKFMINNSEMVLLCQGFFFCVSVDEKWITLIWHKNAKT